MSGRITFRRLLSPSLSFVLFLNCLTLSVQAQKRVIIINADQPNVWTLEQAHYLLAQMHRRNLDLKAKSLDDLDPNEIAGLRFDVMRMLIEFGATFNQADLATNKLVSRNQEFDAQRREELIAERDRLRKESLALTGEIDDLETQKADAESDSDKKRLDAKIAAKTDRRAKVDKEIDFTNDELKTLNAPSGELKATAANVQFDANKLPKSVFDKAFEEAAASQIEKFNQAPRLNASLRLENFLQMQYEIIAKQLTLLRDEVGPGERLLFLEMPQSVNATHHEADKKWAQSWWKIVGYTIRERDGDPVPVPTPTPRVDDNQRPITTVKDVNNLLRGEEIFVRLKPTPTPSPTATNPAPSTPISVSTARPAPTPKSKGRNKRSITKRAPTSAPASNPVPEPALTSSPTPTATPAPTATPMQVRYKNTFVNLDLSSAEARSKINSALTGALTGAELSDRSVRTIDLIPRQSSLNVNDMKLQTRAGAFSFALSTLFGFGSQLNIQRQREQFSQFVQQELYSSAFGKGSREFGWTFTPMPGTDRLQSGERTTYAVVVVPEEATSLVLESNGCYFPRSAYEPNNFADTKSDDWNDNNRTSRNCSGSATKAFVVPIPSGSIGGNNDFWVRGIYYKPVPKGKRIVVLISGSNFSSQIGVLVNGVSLAQSIGLAQPLLRDDSKAGAAAAEELNGEKVRGRIERVDANKIVFSFEADDFEGIPTITLVAPGKAIDLNWLENVDINGINPATLSENPIEHELCGDPKTPGCIVKAAWMFGERAKTNDFKLDSFEAFRLVNGNLRALIHGAGFVSKAKPPTTMVRALYINGVPQSFNTVSAGLIEVPDFRAPSSDAVQATIVTDEDTVTSDPVANPAFSKVSKVIIVSYEAGTDKKAGVLVVRLEGSGFPARLASTDPRRIKVTVTSSTEAYLRITNPSEAEVVTLKDSNTNTTINAVITRKPPPK